MIAPRRARFRDGDDGSVLILLIFLVVILAGLITVIADVSTLFLAQRELQAKTDAAVADAAQHPMLGSLYGGVTSVVPLTQDDVVRAIDVYFADPTHSPHNCRPGSLAVSASLDAQTATVTLSCEVPLPFVKLVDPSSAHRVAVSSRARLVISPAR